MDTIRFFPPHEGVPLSDLAGLCAAQLQDPAFGDRMIAGIAPLARATAGEITFAASRKSLPDLEKSKAGAVFIKASLAPHVPAGVAALVTEAPQAAFALAGAVLVPLAMRPGRVTGEVGVSAGAAIDPAARLENGVVVETGALIGAGAEIGGGTVIGPGAIIGQGCRIGRNCDIGAGATIQHALIGNGVIIHPGARIGQDGFGFAPGPRGMLKIPQVGRVIIQDLVEIGANTCVDRGALDDTVIGEGTKIDNLVQIGHNVRIGRHCALAAMVGIAGSTVVGDGVMIGGAAGLAGHLTVGDGAHIGALSGVATDVPPGARWGGIPARPMTAVLRDAVAANARAFGKSSKRKGGENT